MNNILQAFRNIAQNARVAKCPRCKRPSVVKTLTEGSNQQRFTRNSTKTPALGLIKKFDTYPLPFQKHTNFTIFSEAESPKKCHSARYSSTDVEFNVEYAQCSGAQCSFKFCLKCLCEYCLPHMCLGTPLGPKSPSEKEKETSKRSVAGSKQSKRNLRRLCSIDK